MNLHLRISVNTDLFTTCNGKAIKYDAVGNPTSYDGWAFSWQGGNRLTSMTKAGKSAMSFKYNDSGIRTEKKVGTATTKYMLDGSNIVAMQTGTATPMYFSYDANGKRLGVKYTNGLYYYYVYNQQGDVIAMHNGSGSVVAQYKYDAWGNILSITNGNGVDISNDATSLGYNNPFRYRGYYYDTETGLYYLNARYYNPEWGRFINADTTDVLDGGNDHILENNLFAYCLNNPVNMSDDDGQWPKWATKLAAAVAVVAVVATVAAITVATAGTGTALACIAVGAAKGAATGLVVGAASGAATSAVGHRISTGSWKGAGDAALNGMADGALSGAISGAITGGMNSGACFVAGTAVLAASGHVAIETIKAGDVVWAENPETGEKALKIVEETFIRQTDEFIHIKVDRKNITTTPEHPFWVPQKGWTNAIELRAGDKLLLQNGKIVIIDFIQHELLETPATVYNFRVADFHSYYVTKSSILVHNANYKPLTDGTHRAVINPGELEAPHAHIFKKSKNIGRIFKNGSIDKSLQNNRQAMKFANKNHKEIMEMINQFYGRRW